VLGVNVPQQAANRITLPEVHRMRAARVRRHAERNQHVVLVIPILHLVSESVGHDDGQIPIIIPHGQRVPERIRNTRAPPAGIVIKRGVESSFDTTWTKLDFVQGDQVPRSIVGCH
jgi:hypothetical protein